MFRYMDKIAAEIPERGFGHTVIVEYIWIKWLTAFFILFHSYSI
ncbi:hypothetical protein QTI87_10955 [Clostridium perfringens]|nr:hypothetical protein [Clostridium perfringens]